MEERTRIVVDDNINATNCIYKQYIFNITFHNIPYLSCAKYQTLITCDEVNKHFMCCVCKMFQ